MPIATCYVASVLHFFSNNVTIYLIKIIIKGNIWTGIEGRGGEKDTIEGAELINIVLTLFD